MARASIQRPSSTWLTVLLMRSQRVWRPHCCSRAGTSSIQRLRSRFRRKSDIERRCWIFGTIPHSSITGMNQFAPTDSEHSLDRVLSIRDDSRHDHTTLPYLRRADRDFEKHGPLLCDGNRADPVRRCLPDPALGAYRHNGPANDPSFPAGGRSSQLVPRPASPKTDARISAGEHSNMRLTARGPNRCTDWKKTTSIPEGQGDWSSRPDPSSRAHSRPSFLRDCHDDVVSLNGLAR